MYFCHSPGFLTCFLLVYDTTSKKFYTYIYKIMQVMNVFDFLLGTCTHLQRLQFFHFIMVYFFGSLFQHFYIPELVNMVTVIEVPLRKADLGWLGLTIVLGTSLPPSVCSLVSKCVFHGLG